MIARGLLLLLLLVTAACGPDATPFRLDLVLHRGDTVQCSSDVCQNIGMSCDALMLVQMVPADSPTATPYYRHCARVEGGTDLCVLEGVDLPPREIPNVKVLVQVAVWRYDDPGLARNDAGVPECPEVTFKLNNVETKETMPSPAIAGQSYFEVGSSSLVEVVVGCSDEAELDDDECRATGAIGVDAQVFDFDTFVSVSPAIGAQLDVSLGEPLLDGGAWTLDNPTPHDERIPTVPLWHWDYEPGFLRAACVQVVGPDLQTAAAIECRAVTADDVVAGELEARGMLVDDATLDRVQQALGGSLPQEGFVLGRVLDATGAPAAGIQVLPSQGSVLYLSADMTSTNPIETTSSGAFVSLDAPFADASGDPTTWTATDAVAPAIGGRVQGKVTVVTLQLSSP